MKISLFEPFLLFCFFTHILTQNVCGSAVRFTEHSKTNLKI